MTPPICLRQIRAQIEDTPEDYDREKMKENKARVEDAMHATTAAVEEGIVPATVFRCSAGAAVEADKVEGDVKVGMNCHPPRAR